MVSLYILSFEGDYSFWFQARRHRLAMSTASSSLENDKEKQITRMLVILAILFIAFKIPYTVVLWIVRLHRE